MEQQPQQGINRPYSEDSSFEEGQDLEGPPEPKAQRIMELSQQGLKRPRSKELEKPTSKLQRGERKLDNSEYDRLVRVCMKQEGSQRWNPSKISREDWNFLAGLAIDAGIVGFRHVEPTALCQRLRKIYMPLRYNSPNRGDLFTIIRKFLENPMTYDPNQYQPRTTLTAQRIASAYRPHDVMRAIKVILEYLVRVVIRSTPVGQLGDLNSSSSEELISTTINDLLTWLNNLDDCGDIEVVYMDNYPVTVSKNARSVMDRPGIPTSMLDIITPADALEDSGIMYIPDPESPQTKRWLENLAMVHTHSGFDENGYDYEGMSVQDLVKEMLDKNVNVFPMDMFWFVLDVNNQIVALFGFREISRKNELYRIWGFGSPRKDIDNFPYFVFSLECGSPFDCYDYVQVYVDYNQWKLVTGCSPVFNPYDPNGPIFWPLLNAAGIRVANPPQ